MRLKQHALDRGEIDHELVWALVGLVVFCGFFVYYHLFGLPPLLCHFKHWTGVPCMTCGTTRALIALGGRQFFEAFRMNPLGALLLMLWLLLIPYGLVVGVLRLPRPRPVLSRAEVFALRFVIPLVAIVNWAWVIYDGR